MTVCRWTEPAVVRAQIAASILPERATDTLGDVVLRAHQRDAVNRLRHAIHRFGGALLADDVGLGKTFTALAAVRDMGRLLIVAPASLSAMWTLALERARMNAAFISFETLSRRDVAEGSWDVIVIDEAHHARNAGTRRYGRLASVARRARVLLLSATPVHNDAADLASLLALFLGSRARHLTAAEVSACIVRRSRQDVRDVHIPGRAPPTWLEVPSTDDLLPTLLNLPAPCPPRDGGDGGVLVTLSLVRAWASTEAALRSTLRRRIARADALADALATGRHPTRAELRAWVVGDDATQLAFPELTSDPVEHDVRRLLDAVRTHAAASRGLLAVVASGAGAIDDARSEIIRDIRRRHAGERIVLFSQFADSVHAMFTRLRADGGVASVTANGAWIASGPLTRTQALNRFAPQATSSATPSRAESIELLIATDLLSEGLNLQDASVVIHLDLPWTAARLNQRLGRVWRLGSSHAQVHEYALAPPASADAILQLTAHLKRKAGTAWTTVGESISALLGSPARDAPRAEPDRISASEEVRRVLERWTSATDSRDDTSSPVARPFSSVTCITSVRANVGGWIAAIGNDEDVRLVVGRDGTPVSSEPRCVLELVRLADGQPCAASPTRVSRAQNEIDRYLDATHAARSAGIADVGSRTRAAVASRIARLAGHAPPHRRSSVTRLAAEARHVVARSRSAGAERLLAALVTPDSGMDGADAAETWLERIIDAGTAASPNDPPGEEPRERLLALILLVPTEAIKPG